MSFHDTLHHADRSDLASSQLSSLLDAELDVSPSYLKIYSSHLAMALTALHQLGAAPSVLQSTLDRHVSGSFEARDDREVLDQRISEVHDHGIAATVRSRLPALTSGPGTALFHPLIRLGYALDVQHVGQVAAALLDWERRLHVLPVADRTATPAVSSARLADVVSDLARRVAASAAGAWAETYELDEVARRPEVVRAIAELDTGDASVDELLDDISQFALAAHVSADAFITLHLVTGARALRTVMPYLDAATARELLSHTAADMVVAFAALGAPELLTDADLDQLRAARVPSAESIAALAIASPDPHVIKLANAALVEEGRTADPLYRLIAARVVDAM